MRLLAAADDAVRTTREVNGTVRWSRACVSASVGVIGPAELRGSGVGVGLMGSAGMIFGKSVPGEVPTGEYEVTGGLSEIVWDGKADIGHFSASAQRFGHPPNLAPRELEPFRDFTHGMAFVEEGIDRLVFDEVTCCYRRVDGVLCGSYSA